MDDFLLTHNEKILMDFFWESDQPLTSVDLIEKTPDKKNYIPIMIKSLLAKGLITECGTVLYGKRYARAFTPTMTREEYSAKLALLINKKKNVVSKIAVALIDEVPDSEKYIVISELEDMISNLKKELHLEDS